MRCVISGLGKDRGGIVAGVSGVLAEKGASIDDINQTILDSIFSMTMLVRLDTDTAGFNEVQEALAKEGEELGTVETLETNGVQSLLAVKGAKRHLIPLIPEYVLDIDLDSELIQVEWHADWS